MDSSISLRPQQSLQNPKLLGAALIVAGSSAQATALPFIDASDDLLPTHAGPRNADLDVVQADAIKAGCPGDLTRPNGEPNAGIQALGSRDFTDAQESLPNVKP